MTTMDFSIPKKTFTDALARVSPTAERSRRIPALGAVHIRAHAGAVTLRCASGREEQDFTTPAMVRGEGEAYVPAATLAKLLRRVGNDTISFYSLEKRLAIVSGPARISLAAIEGEASKISKSGAFIELNARALVKVMKAAEAFMCTDDTRPHLAGMKIEWTPERLRAIAADGHRLIVADERVTAGFVGEMRFLVPRASARRLRAFVEKARVNTVLVAASDKTLTVRAGSGSMACTFVEAKFPPHEKIHVDKGATSITAPRGALLDASRRVVARYIAALEFEGDRITVIGDDPEIADTSEAIEIARHGSDNALKKIGVQPRYLADALAALSTDYVTLTYGPSPTSPIGIAAVGGDLDARIIVMPARL